MALPTPGRSERFGQGQIKSQAGGYLSKAPSADDYLKRQRRGNDGSIFTPRTMPVPVNSNNNLRDLTAKARRGLPNIPTPGVSPRGIPGGRGSLEHQVRRMEEYRGGGLRHGYHHYDPFWRDWHFGYHHYVFIPYSYGCVFSPYYWYWSVPGYIVLGRVWYYPPGPIILIGSGIHWTYCGRGQYYSTYYGNSRYDNYSSLDRALSDLVDAFRYSDGAALGKFLPRGGSVELFIDGEYAYTMSTDDYYDITSDMIYSVYTTDFKIVDVRRASGGEYAVVARHDFVDVSNDRQTVWLTFTLVRKGGYYAITQAGTSTFRPY
ncbi:MAG: hypothetical protein IH851_05290 [Armatimonadetes bacterium]|nr:hypothetical protein [Armatimonadota bacterium]